MMGNLLKKYRLRLIIAVVLIVGSVAGFVVHQQRSKTADYGHLIGQWVRPDGGYVLNIKSISLDGKIEMAYLNPRPINVSKAQANMKAGKIELLIELLDKYYPGSYYTLTYDSKSDRLVGVYHHLGIGQNFDIFFLRKQGPS
jgi:hypothetical protein